MSRLKKSDLVLEDIGADVTLKCVTQYPGIKPVWLQKWSFKISSGQIQNYLSAVPTDCCCFSDQMQQRLHESMDGYSKFVSLKSLSQQNPFLSLKIQASSEIIWFESEILYGTDHRTLRRLSLCTNRAITLYVSSLQDISP